MTITFCKCRHAHPISALPQSQWGDAIKRIPEACERPDECDERHQGCQSVCREYLRVMFIRAREVNRLKKENWK